MLGQELGQARRSGSEVEEEEEQRSGLRGEEGVEWGGVQVIRNFTLSSMAGSEAEFELPEQVRAPSRAVGGESLKTCARRALDGIT